MIKIRRSEERGHVQHGWLDTRHTFSFASYHDPEHMGYRSLRVINEDQVAPGEGFGAHPHRDMEIITFVTEGRLRHQDSMGNGSVIEAGEVQRMTAGHGVVHSEYNDSNAEGVHLFQIWIVPEQNGLEPSYEEAHVDRSREGLQKVAGPEGSDALLTIHADATLSLGELEPEHEVRYPLAPGHGAWLQVVQGAVALDGQRLGQGDGAAIEGEQELVLRAEEPAEVLLFDLG